MISTWDDFERKLREFPEGTHHFMDPCAADRIAQASQQFGQLPSFVEAMLRCSNGIELFIAGMPYATLFGLSPEKPLPPLEWAPDWYIDKFTTEWRRTRPGSRDLILGVTHYGALFVYSEDHFIQEWTSETGEWLDEPLSVSEWFESLIQRGEEFLHEE